MYQKYLHLDPIEMSIALSEDVSEEFQYPAKLKKRELKANRKRLIGNELGLAKSDVSKLIDSYHNLVGLIRDNQNYGSHASHLKKNCLVGNLENPEDVEGQADIISVEESEGSETNRRVNKPRQIEARPRSEIVISNGEKDDEIVNRGKLSCHQVISNANIWYVSALNVQNPSFVIAQKN